MKKNDGSLFVVAGASLWAVDGILRRSLYSLPPLVIVLYEHLIGLLILAPTNWRQLHPRLIKKDSWLLAATIGLFSGLIGTLAFTAALQQVSFIPFSVVLLVQKLQPIFAGLTAFILLKERFTTRYFLWALLALVAGFFVTFPNGQVSLIADQGQIIAALLALTAAICWGGSTSLSKLLLKKQTEIQATGLRFVWTVVWALLAMLVFSPALFFITPSVSQLGLLVSIALSTGMVAVYLYYRGLKSTPVMIATILELTFPVLAVFIDIFLYKTVLAPTQYLAAVAMLICMYQVNRSHIAHSV
ncbi:DMT family transporter [Candidatus Woesebacteria bacterium]|nr:DMT family transporter [Candidatus Woesebacteria bacterium]